MGGCNRQALGYLVAVRSLATSATKVRSLATPATKIACVVVLVAFMACSASAQPPSQNEGWQRFRGPNGAGSIAHCDVPLPWSPSDVAWEVALPGLGNASPIFYGDLAFVSSADPASGEQHLHAVDIASGQIQWHNRYPSRKYPIHARSSFASSTPCVNATALFFCWANPESLVLLALGHDGSELWRRDLGAYVSQHGFGGSPILCGQTLVLVNSQDAEELPQGIAPGQSRVMAFDSLTGEQLWETNRTTTRVCYSTPTLFDDAVAGPALLLSNTGDGFSALSLQTGSGGSRGRRKQIVRNQPDSTTRCAIANRPCRSLCSHARQLRRSVVSMG